MKRCKRPAAVFSDSMQIIHRLDRSKLPLMIFRALIVSAIPFITIVMSAGIINRLSEGEGFGGTLSYAIAGIVVICALSLCGDWLKKINDVKSTHCRRVYDFSKNEKMMAMDYAELESPASNSLRSKLRAEENMGFGLPLLFSCLDTLFESVFAAALSLVLLCSVSAALPVIESAAFISLSAILSAAVSLLRKRTDDRYLAKIKDDDFWPDAMMQAQTMAFGGVFTYKEGKDIRIFGYGGVIRGVLNEGMRFLLGVAKDFAAKPALTNGIVGAVKGLIMGGSFIFAAVFASDGGMPFGTVLLLASVLYQLTAGVSRGIAISATMLSSAESLQMYIQFIRAPDSQYRGSLPVEKRSDHAYEIEFRAVSFRYPGSETYALKNLNLKLNIGKRMALVGMNGSGKTTLIKLLCRLYDPSEGEILLNGINIAKYDLDEYRNIFAVVFQDFTLPSFEIAQVLSASEEYDLPRAEACLRLAGLSERLRSMPDGLQTFVYKDFADGVDISGGEAQKIAIARALYKDAPFIIMDEPTAALDPIAEFEVYAKLNDIVESKTAVFISHRLSSCRFCHDIAVFHEGELVQRGGHDELLADEGGKYYELWNAQAQYYVKR